MAFDPLTYALEIIKSREERADDLERISLRIMRRASLDLYLDENERVQDSHPDHVLVPREIMHDLNNVLADRALALRVGIKKEEG